MAGLMLALFGAVAALSAMPGTARGQIFVSNLSGNTIGEYNASTGAAINAALISGLETPEGIVVSGGNLFVANNGNAGTAHVGQYTTTGTTVNAALVSGLSGAINNIAISGSKLFVSNFSNNTIGEYDATTGATINAALVTGLTSPGGIAVSGGHLFVVNLGTLPGTGTVDEFDATTGAAISAPLISGLNNPEGLVASGSNLFVVKRGMFSNGSYVANSGSIGEYSTSGQTVNAALVSGLNMPRQITESGGNLFVTDFTNTSNGTVGEYSAATGATINATLVSGLDHPVGIAVVPEPGSLVLAVLGIGGLAAWGCRRRAG